MLGTRESFMVRNASLSPSGDHQWAMWEWRSSSVKTDLLSIITVSTSNFPAHPVAADLFFLWLLDVCCNSPNFTLYYVWITRHRIKLAPSSSNEYFLWHQYIIVNVKDKCNCHMFRSVAFHHTHLINFKMFWTNLIESSFRTDNLLSSLIWNFIIPNFSDLW